jgi:hypothetical protein
MILGIATISGHDSENLHSSSSRYLHNLAYTGMGDSGYAFDNISLQADSRWIFLSTQQQTEAHFNRYIKTELYYLKVAHLIRSNLASAE